MKRNGIFVIVTVLSLIGLVFSFMALDLHIEHVLNPEKTDSYCNLSAQLNCGAVIKSDWSVLFGRPIALYGVAFYLFLTLFGILSALISTVARRARLDALLILATAAVLDSLFLLYISLFEIKTLCPVCAGVYVVNFLLLIAVWWSDRSVNYLTRALSGIGTLLLAPVRFVTVWIDRRDSSVRVFSVLSLLILFGSLFATEYAFYTLISFRQGTVIESQLDLPWPKSYELPDTISIDKGAWGDYYIGEPEAPIKIVEMFDYECGHCRHFYKDIKTVLKDYEGKYLLIFKNYPLDKSCNVSMQFDGHKNACYAALLSRCAGEQGLFHKVSDYILRAEIYGGEESAEVMRAKMYQAIEHFGLDAAEIEECMQDDRQMEHIKSDIELGNMLGIQGTPTVWVNGKQLPGLDEVVLRKVFDDILGR